MILDALRERYSAPAWAIFFEVSNGTGGHSSRYADAVAMSLYPSRGLDILGFEVKTDRRDWIRELKDPKKADVIASYCDYWFLVISDKEIAKNDEIPSAWGVLLMNGKTLRQVKAPQKLKPKALGRPFVAALLRRAHEAAEKVVRSGEAYEKAYAEGKKRGEENVSSDKSHFKRDLESLQESLAEFEKVSGVKIDNWNGGYIGESVKLVQHLRGTPAEELEELAKKMENVAADFRNRISMMNSMKEKV